MEDPHNSPQNQNKAPQKTIPYHATQMSFLATTHTKTNPQIPLTFINLPEQDHHFEPCLSRHKHKKINSFHTKIIATKTVFTESERGDTCLQPEGQIVTENQRPFPSLPLLHRWRHSSPTNQLHGNEFLIANQEPDIISNNLQFTTRSCALHTHNLRLLKSCRRIFSLKFDIFLANFRKFRKKKKSFRPKRVIRMSLLRPPLTFNNAQMSPPSFLLPSWTALRQKREICRSIWNRTSDFRLFLSRKTTSKGAPRKLIPCLWAN